MRRADVCSATNVIFFKMDSRVTVFRLSPRRPILTRRASEGPRELPLASALQKLRFSFAMAATTSPKRR
jgi:hypothetical protein